MVEVTPEEKLLNLIKQTQGKKKLKKELRIFTKVNIILIGLTIVILAVFLVDVATFDYEIPELSVELPEQKEVIVPMPIEYDEEDIDTIAERNVSISKEDVVKNLNLLGIVTGKNNQAIIEDKQSKKTHFLYKGDSFGEFKVYDIKDSEVILDYKGEKIRLNI